MFKFRRKKKDIDKILIFNAKNVAEKKDITIENIKVSERIVSDVGFMFIGILGTAICLYYTIKVDPDFREPIYYELLCCSLAIWIVYKYHQSSNENKNLINLNEDYEKIRNNG